MKPIYLDYNATTPVAPEATKALLPYLTDRFGNPSSSHQYGREAREAVEAARADTAGLLGCHPQEILFTAGGTESNNLAIQGIWHAAGGGHLITSAVEHPAVLRVCQHMVNLGATLTVLPVDPEGLVNPADLEAALRPDTKLISIMHANNEVGSIQPIPELAAIARARNIPFHTDAAQSIGKIPVEVNPLGVDLLTLAGHKLYAPKGVGALYVRSGLELAGLIHGAGHEGGRRPGTENVPHLAALGTACRLIREGGPGTEHLSTLRDRLEERLERALPPGTLRRNGPRHHRLPNTASLAFRGVTAPDLLARLEGQVAASAGSACHEGAVSISPVLQAMGVPAEWARGTVRLSLGRYSTESEIDRATELIAQAVRELGGNPCAW